MKRPLILSAVLLATSLGAFAQSPASVVRREVHQQRQIEQGLLNGSITAREAAVLLRQQGRIDRLEARALRDGWLNVAACPGRSAPQDPARLAHPCWHSRWFFDEP